LVTCFEFYKLNYQLKRDEMQTITDKSTIIAMDGIFPFNDELINSTFLSIVDPTELNEKQYKLLEVWKHSKH